MRRLLAATAALFCALVPAPPAAAAATCPQVIAHRTLMTERPENTVAGIQAVPATGAAGVEMDVQWSSSGFPVLMHDATVDRTTNGTGAPGSLGLGQLTGLLAQDYAPWKTDPTYTHTHVPYGNEFMAATADADLDVVLDIHATPTQLGMQRLRIYVADYHGWAGRTLVMAPAAQVVAMRGWEAGLRYAVIEYPPGGRVYTPDYLRSIGAAAYVLPWTAVTAGLVGYLHAGGIRVYAWTSDRAEYETAATWQALAGYGVDAVITNEPAAAVAAYAAGCSSTPEAS